MHLALLRRVSLRMAGTVMVALVSLAGLLLGLSRLGDHWQGQQANAGSKAKLKPVANSSMANSLTEPDKMAAGYVALEADATAKSPASLTAQRFANARRGISRQALHWEADPLAPLAPLDEGEGL